MNELQKAFRDKLLDVEKPSANYKAKYEKEILAMVEKKLTGLRKFGCIVGLAMGLGFAGLFGTFTVVAKQESLWLRLFFAIGAMFGLIIIATAVSVLKKGTINRKEDELASAWLGWCAILVVVIIVLVFGRGLTDPITRISAIASVLVFELMAATLLLKAIIQRSELNNREKLLEIEYRLAELAERIENENSE